MSGQTSGTTAIGNQTRLVVEWVDTEVSIFYDEREHHPLSNTTWNLLVSTWKSTVQLFKKMQSHAVPESTAWSREYNRSHTASEWWKMSRMSFDGWAALQEASGETCIKWAFLLLWSVTLRTEGACMSICTVSSTAPGGAAIELSEQYMFKLGTCPHMDDYQMHQNIHM